MRRLKLEPLFLWPTTNTTRTFSRGAARIPWAVCWLPYEAHQWKMSVTGVLVPHYHQLWMPPSEAPSTTAQTARYDTIRYDMVDDLHWKTDMQAASLI